MLKVGIIGCGFMGAMHTDCYKNIEGVEICALADLREEKAEELKKGTKAKIYKEGKDLIKNEKLDIIDICLPTYLHAEYAMAAMEKSEYVFVEKPVSLTVEESKNMLEKAKETSCNVQIGQVIRFWDEYVKLAEIVKENKLGKVVNGFFRRISPVPTWGWNDWLLDASLSGGAAQDLHIHDIDYVLSLFGKPNSVSTVKNSLGEKNSYIHSLLKYDDFPISVEGTWGLPESHPFQAEFRVVFEKGVVELQGGKFMLYNELGAEEIKIEKVSDLKGSTEGGNISDLGGYYNELLYFTDCAKNKKKIEKATLSDASISLEFVLDEINNA